MSTQARILILDADTTDRRALVRALQRERFEVHTSDEVASAIELSCALQPDLLVLDLTTPGCDGIEICTRLKERPETASVPIVFSGADCDADRILRTFLAGGCDYLAKPFRIDEVIARIAAHIELSRRKSERETQTGRRIDANVERDNPLDVDPASKILNQRSWSEIVEREQKQLRTVGSPYAVVKIGIDHFEAFRDISGHQMRDGCLRKVAEAIARTIRPSDTLGHDGDDTFVVFVPTIDADPAFRLAERIRMTVWQLAISHPGAPESRRVTVSVGVATSSTDAWQDVLKDADQALDVAKKAGRNMVACAHRPCDGDGASDATIALEVDSASESRLRVLVVDDERTNRMIFKRSLERAGYTVCEAENGQVALACIENEAPHVIILDVMMPVMDGLECMKRIKSNPALSDIPVIMASALNGEEDILAGLKSGADEYLAKPVSTPELVMRVQTMVRQQQNRVELLRSFQARGEQVRALLRLVQFCRAVSTSDTLDEILEQTLAATAEILHTSRVAVLLPDAKATHLEVAKSIGMVDEFATVTNVPLEEATINHVYASGKSLVRNAIDADTKDGETIEARLVGSPPSILVPLNAARRIVGVLGAANRIPNRPFEPTELEYVDLLSTIAAAAIDGTRMRQARDRATDAIMLGLAKLAEHRDNDTGRHVDRVMHYCQILAEELRLHPRFANNIDDAFVANLVRAVPLHDIGKVAIPDRILLHPGRLTDEEMEIMRTHATIGARTIETLVEQSPGVSFLEMAADVAHYHHERFDGTGYPLGLRGEAIPLAARITTLADVYDALTSERVYKRAMSHDRATTVIVEASGTQFDPAIVDAFLQREADFANLARTMADGGSDANAAHKAAKPKPARTPTESLVDTSRIA